MSPVHSVNYVAGCSGGSALNADTLNQRLDPAGDIVEGGILIRPLCHRPGILRHRLQSGKVGPTPAAGAQDHRHDDRLAAVVALKRLLDLDAPAIIRCDETGADQEQDDVGRGQVPVDLLRPLVARIDVAVMPLADQTGATPRAASAKRWRLCNGR